MPSEILILLIIAAAGIVGSIALMICNAVLGRRGAAQAAEASPGMVLTITMFWALSTLVILSRKMVRSFSAKFSLVRFPDTAYLYTP